MPFNKTAYAQMTRPVAVQTTEGAVFEATFYPARVTEQSLHNMDDDALLLHALHSWDYVATNAKGEEEPVPICREELQLLPTEIRMALLVAIINSVNPAKK